MLNTILAIAVIVVVFFILFKIFSMVIRVLLILVFLLLAYFTNPSADKHIAAVRHKADLANKQISAQDVVVDDYKIFSLTKMQEGTDDRIIGAGAFTKVVILGKP